MITLRRLFITLLALFTLSLPAFAQQTVTTTTTSNAMTITQKTVTLAATTGVSVGTGLFIDREGMSVTAINTTSKVATVVRGTDGSIAQSHASGATVYIGPTSGVTGAGPFWLKDPQMGSCTLTNEQYSLRIVVPSGYIWACVKSQWSVVGWPYLQAVQIGPALGTAIASAATIAPVSYVTHITGTAAVVNITVPAGCTYTCTVVLVPDGAFTTTAAGNIAIASTAVVGKALEMLWDGTKWYPSY